MANDRQLVSFDEAQKSARALNPAVRKPMTDLLKDVKDFVDTNKIQCEYKLAVDNNDLEHSGVILGKILMPKTLLNFLLLKYVAQVKPKSGAKKPSPTVLLGILLKHQTFNTVFVGNELKCMLPEGTVKTPKKQEDKQ